MLNKGIAEAHKSGVENYYDNLYDVPENFKM